MGWLIKLLGLLGGWGDLKKLAVRLLKIAKDSTANTRQKKKDDAVEDAIAAALADDGSQLHDNGRAEERGEAD